MSFFWGEGSNTHLSLESMRSSGFASLHLAVEGAKTVCTMNLCLLFSLGSYSKGCSITVKTEGTRSATTPTISTFGIHTWI
uniref:Uncharacterized protein n=1 Tax=Esox lucius TaxID=8010 RepID=A0A3P8YUB3_ESOLU